MLDTLIGSPVFGVTITFVVYAIASSLYVRSGRRALLNNVMVSIAVLIGILVATGIDYETYVHGGRIISFFLGPAVVALGVPLYERIPTIRRNARAISVAVIAASVTGIVSAAGIAALLGASHEVIMSIAPKSVTTPIAMGIAESLGGIPALSAAIVIVTGVLGAVVGPAFLRIIGVRTATAFGIAMGSSAHGIGTARAAEESILAEAISGLALSLNGIVTAVLTPVILRAMGV